MGRNPASCCWFWNNVDVYNWVNLGYIRTIVLLKSFAINGIFFVLTSYFKSLYNLIYIYLGKL
jgi:hypothetical protein